MVITAQNLRLLIALVRSLIIIGRVFVYSAAHHLVAVVFVALLDVVDDARVGLLGGLILMTGRCSRDLYSASIGWCGARLRPNACGIVR